MGKFIKVHDGENKPCLVRIDNIVAVVADSDYGFYGVLTKSVIFLDTGMKADVVESPDEIEDMMRQ